MITSLLEIDFRRDSIEHIEARIIALVAVRMESQAKRKAEIERKAKVEALRDMMDNGVLDTLDALKRFAYFEAEIAKLEAPNA